MIRLRPSGFAGTGPASRARSSASCRVGPGERTIAAAFRASDPFEVEIACELSPTGRHAAIGSCGDVVCCHCSLIFWS